MKQILLLFIGIVIALFCLEGLLQTSSFVLKYANKISNSQKIEKKLKAKDDAYIRILCIGESTTYGQYTKMLPYFLDKNKNKDYIIIDCGIPGTNMKNIAERINNQINYYQPDIIITMMGINDAQFNDKQIYKQYPIKIFNLFLLIKRNIENIVATKLYAQENKKIYYQKIVDDYFNTGKGLEILIDIVDKNPKDEEAIKSLIYTYRMDLNYSLTEKYSNIFLKHHKTDSSILFMLTDCYIKQEKFDDAYKLILATIENTELSDKQKNKYLSDLVESFIYYSTLEQTKKYYEFLTNNKIETSFLDDLYNYLKANNIDIKYYTYKNKYKYFTREPNLNTEEIKKYYQFIAKQIIDNDIIYICMGYPTMPIKQFELFFEETDLMNKIYFVSNEDNFKEVLNKYSYYQIFRDNFAGTFGHCTDYGNELIAKNLAEAIIKLID